MNSLYIFLLFPESDEEVLDLCYNSDCNLICHNLDLIKSILRGKERYEFFYDSENISEFKNKVQQICDGDESAIFKLIRNSIGNHSKNVEKVQSIERDCTYYLWKLSSGYVDCANKELAVAAEYSNQENVDVAVISFYKKGKRDVLPVIKDAHHHKELPKLYLLEYFESALSFIEWYKYTSENRKFNLRDVSRFEKTHRVYSESKEPIYKEIDTGYYWYYDYYHKDNKEHYEVFDKKGDHLGEANINGNLDSSKKDRNKRITL